MKCCAGRLVHSPAPAWQWLDPALSMERVEVMVVRRGEPSAVLGWFRVDRAIDNVRNDFPDLLEPISGR